MGTGDLEPGTWDNNTHNYSSPILHALAETTNPVPATMELAELPGFHTGFVGGEKFVGHCHSVMHEYETRQILF